MSKDRPLAPTVSPGVNLREVKSATPVNTGVIRK